MNDIIINPDGARFRIKASNQQRDELAKLSRIVKSVTGEILASGGLELAKIERSDVGDSDAVPLS